MDHRGQVPGMFRVGRNVMFHEDAVERWLASGMGRPAEHLAVLAGASLSTGRAPPGYRDA